MANSKFIMFLVISTCKAAALTECYRNVIRIQKIYPLEATKFQLISALPLLLFKTGPKRVLFSKSFCSCHAKSCLLLSLISSETKRRHLRGVKQTEEFLRNTFLLCWLVCAVNSYQM